MILSRQPVLTEHFTKGTVFVDHSVDSIVAGVQTLVKQERALAREITELAAEKQEQWEIAFRELLAIIGDRT